MKKRFVVFLSTSMIAVFGQVHAEQKPVAVESSAQTGHVEHDKATTKKNVTWEEFNNVALESTNPLKTYQTKWKFELAENSDLKISVDERSGQESRIGKILMISGQALLINGITLDKNSELNFLDGPVLMCQLAINLMHYAFPEGPNSVSKKSPVDLSEAVRSIIISSPNSQTYFSPPWKVTGFAEPANNSIAFDLKFSYKTEPGSAENSEIWFKGVWEHSTTPPQFSDSMPLQDWKISIIDPETQQLTNSSPDDSTDLKVISGYRTLGDLRKAILAASNK